MSKMFYRPVLVKDEMMLFHTFSNGMAICENEDGKIVTIEVSEIKFIDDIYKTVKDKYSNKIEELTYVPPKYRYTHYARGELEELSVGDTVYDICGKEYVVTDIDFRMIECPPGYTSMYYGRQSNVIMKTWSITAQRMNEGKVQTRYSTKTIYMPRN